MCHPEAMPKDPAGFFTAFRMTKYMNLFVTKAYAAICNPALPAPIGCGGVDTGGSIIGNIISATIGMFLIIGSIATLIFFMIGALRWILSSGDKTKLQAAQEQITNAIIGIVIMAAVWAIAALISTFTGIGLFGTGGATFQLPTLDIQNALPKQSNAPQNPTQGHSPTQGSNPATDPGK